MILQRYNIAHQSTFGNTVVALVKYFDNYSRQRFRTFDQYHTSESFSSLLNMNTNLWVFSDEQLHAMSLSLRADYVYQLSKIKKRIELARETLLAVNDFIYLEYTNMAFHRLKRAENQITKMNKLRMKINDNLGTQRRIIRELNRRSYFTYVVTEPSDHAVPQELMEDVITISDEE